MCDHANREAAMTVIERDATGKPTIWCDPCIEPLVTALNAAGIRTVASCCGHGRQPGNIALADSRELLILPDYETARAIERARLLEDATATPHPARKGRPVNTPDPTNTEQLAEKLPLTFPGEWHTHADGYTHDDSFSQCLAIHATNVRVEIPLPWLTDLLAEVANQARREALREAADAIQAMHPGEVKNSVIFLRNRADSPRVTPPGKADQ